MTLAVFILKAYVLKPMLVQRHDIARAKVVGRKPSMNKTKFTL